MSGPLIPYHWRRSLAWWLWRLAAPEGDCLGEIRPNDGAKVDGCGGCVDTDEVVGSGFLHVEQMHDKCFWARLDLPTGEGIVMWFNSKSKITLLVEYD